MHSSRAGWSRTAIRRGAGDTFVLEPDRSGMVATAGKLRLVLSVLESLEAAATALESLLARGIPAERVRLIAEESTVNAWLAHAPSPAGSPCFADRTAIDSLADGLVPLDTTTSGPALLVSAELLTDWRRGWGIPALWGNDPGAADAPSLAAEFERQVRAGAAILVVQSLTLAEQWLSTRILLDLSSSPVLSLECSQHA